MRKLLDALGKLGWLPVAALMLAVGILAWLTHEALRGVDRLRGRKDPFEKDDDGI